MMPRRIDHFPTTGRQAGVALVTAILIVALVSIWSASVLRRQEMAMGRAGAHGYSMQAWQYGIGLESWALEILLKDHETNGSFDTRQDIWAAVLPEIPVEGGRLSGRVIDLDGRFDINSLVDAGGGIDRQRLEQFRRLLLILELDPFLADSAADWLDADISPEPSGAEDLRYLSRDPAYRAANQPFQHVSELKQVSGMDNETWAVLRPHVTALPRPSGAFSSWPINVNTTTQEVLRSLDPGISPTVADKLLRDGRAQFEGTEQFYTALEGYSNQAGPYWQNLRAKNIVGVKSHHFLARGEVELDERRYTYYSQILRMPPDTAVIKRSRGVW